MKWLTDLATIIGMVVIAVAAIAWADHLTNNGWVHSLTKRTEAAQVGATVSGRVTQAEPDLCPSELKALNLCPPKDGRKTGN
jgi:hypothetical protein